MGNCKPTLTTGASADVPVEWKSRAQIAEATSRDAYARLAVLETERAELIGRTAAAERAAQLIAEQIQQAQRDHKDETAALLACIDALTGSVDRLTGMERHLRLQTDLLRQELGQQAEFYKGRAEAAEKALAIERSQTDALRRLLGNRAPPVVSGTR